MARPLLYFLVACLIGRTQELIPFLAPLRIVLLTGILCVAATLAAGPGGKQPVLPQREVRIALALGGLAALLLPFSVWAGGSLAFLIGAYGRLLMLLMLVVALATDTRVIRNIIVAVLLGVAILGILTLEGSAARISQQYDIARAYASKTYDPNDVAMIMVVTLPLAALGSFGLRGVSRLLAASTALITVLATILTVSRTGFVGLALVCGLLIFRLRTAGARLLAGILVLIFLAAAPAKYWHVMQTIWKPASTSGGYLERGIWTRMELWDRGLDLLTQRPLTGVGMGQYHVADGLRYGRRGGWVTAHNSFLQIAGELGVLGLAIFVMLIFSAIRSARRVARAAREDPRLRDLEWAAAAVEIALYAYVVVGFTLSQAYASILFFLIGLATALRLEAERRQSVVVVAMREAPVGRAVVPVPSP